MAEAAYIASVVDGAGAMDLRVILGACAFGVGLLVGIQLQDEPVLASGEPVEEVAYHRGETALEAITAALRKPGQ